MKVAPGAGVGGNMAAAVLLAGLLGVGCAPRATPPATAPRPPLPQRIAVREGWLEKRHALLLDMMRKHKVGMWIVVNEEFHDDPLTPLVAPPRPYVGNRDVFVFVDAGEAGLRKVAITGFYEEQLARFFETPKDPRPAKDVLPELVKAHQPPTIALAIGGRRGVTRSLTHDSYLWLVELLGPDASARIVPAADLIEEYVDTRIPEERSHYTTLVAATEDLARRALSNEVIRPGVTTVGDVRRWLYDRADALGYGLWFQPDMRLQRHGMANQASRGFLAVADEGWVIQRGDLLHVDFGLVDLGLMSDWQKMAYVLRPGEKDAPEGLTKALGRTNALQDAVTGAARPHRAAGDIYKEAMVAMETRGIAAKIYSHPLGNHGHGLGASIDYRAQDDRAAKPLRPGSYMAIELNTVSKVPEWDDQEVFVMQEDPAWLSDTGYVFFRPRQERFYLVR